MKLKIEYVPIESLKTYANNAKIHTAEQIEQIKKSIQEFGMNDPIAIWKNDEIIEGHGRLIACKELGMTEVPIVRLDDLTDGQRRAYALAHNKLTMNTDFDKDILSIEVQDIAELVPEIDLTELGFGDFELAMLTGDFEPEPYDDELVEEYSEKESDYTAKNRVIIVFDDSTEGKVKKILGVEEIKKVVYDAEELP